MAGTYASPYNNVNGASTTPNDPYSTSAGPGDTSGPGGDQTPTGTEMPSIFSDPAYLAYVRQSQGAVSAATAAAVLRGQQTQDAANNQISGLEAERPAAQQGALQNASQRGITNSGTRLINQANVDKNIAGQEANAQANSSSQQADVTQQLANQVANIKQQVAEAGLQSASASTGNYGVVR